MTKAAMPGFRQAPQIDGEVHLGTANRTGRFTALNLPAAQLPPTLTGIVGEAGITREQEYGRMLKTLVSNVPGMVYRCRNDADWTMEFVSDGFERLTGYRVSDILHNHRIRFEDLIHPDDRARMRDAMAEVEGEGEPFDVEYRIVHADSTLRWVWERGIGVYNGSPRPIAYEGLIQDITARRLAEHALIEAERRYRGLFDNAIEGIFRTSPDGHFIEANPAVRCPGSSRKSIEGTAMSYGYPRMHVPSSTLAAASRLTRACSRTLPNASSIRPASNSRRTTTP